MPINKLNFSVPITDVIRERFMSFVSIQPSGCWLWAGRLDPDYGRFTVHGVTLPSASIAKRNSLPARRVACLVRADT